MKLKKITQEQIDKIAELFIKLTNKEITEEEYIKLIKENSKSNITKTCKLKPIDAVCKQCLNYNGCKLIK